MVTRPEQAALPISPVGWDDCEWTPQHPQMHSRRESARQTGAFRAAVPAALGGWSPALSSELSADVEDATRQLVEFGAHVERSLMTADAALGPMSAVLLRSESTSSSQIEQLTTTAKQLALAEIGEGRTANAQTVVGSVRAMEAAMRLADDISAAAILEMHRALMSHSALPADVADAGRLRTEQVWIGPGEAGPLRADFVPPQHRRVAPAIDDLVAFAARPDIPALVHIAVAHAQFETIHPFTDGNGRTGRALVQAMLRRSGLVTTATVPLSAGLLVDVDAYFDALGAFREGDAAPIVRRFAQASRFAAVTGRRLVDLLADELSRSAESLGGMRRDAAARRVLPLLVGQPVVHVRFVADELGVSEMTALRALDALVERGVLSEITGRRRGRVWQHTGVLTALDDFAASIRRRPAG